MKNEIKKQWKIKGRHAVIVKVTGHFCAYVETKLKGVGYSKEYGDYNTSPTYNIDCHGGITFAGTLEAVGLPKDKWYFGMDFAHSGDHTEAYDCMSCRWGKCHKWTLEEVEAETEKMASSILAYEKKAVQFEKLHKEYLKKIKEVNCSRGITNG
jgi:hypothetical protein